jgi:tRNA (guanine-N7-)-methyltransferase
MGRVKQKRFVLNKSNERIVEPEKPLYDTIKGNWHSRLFYNSNPIVVELGCGKGEYTVNLAQVFKDKNFIGTDIKGSRIFVGAKQSSDLELGNTAFLRTRIQNLADFFAPGEITEIWITFPDPRPRGKDERRRLTGPRFLGIYKNLLTPGGLVHLKTDDADLFQYSKETAIQFGCHVIHATESLYQSPLAALHHGIKTYYEKIFLAEGKPIHYLQFKFTNDL